MLIEKEVARPGTYWYVDQKTGLPRKLVVTPELIKHWHDTGSAMLSAGLTVPVPFEHDFDAHPMTPKDKLLNNAGEVREYRIKEIAGRNGTKIKDVLFSVVDIQDPDAKKKVGHSIRWTSPWINSFTDGSGREWKNVISHLALTTRPRIVDQQPFSSVAAALSLATDAPVADPPKDGFCISRAGRLFVGKKSKRLRARYPMAFSLWGGVALGEDDMPPKKDKKEKSAKSKKPESLGGDPDDNPTPSEGEADEFESDLPDEEMGEDTGTGGNDGEGGAGGPPTSDGPLTDANSDIKMEEILCHLLQALGVPMPDQSNEVEFKRHLYEAAMSKVKELTSKGMGKDGDDNGFKPDQNQPPTQQPNASQPNPLIQQEQQPMFMSLEDINKLPEPTRGMALAMHAENIKLQAKLDANEKVTNSLRDAKLKEANTARNGRIAILGRLSPKVKADLEAMVAQPNMALSMGDGGAVVDPMGSMLSILEKGVGDLQRQLPALLTTDSASLSIQAHPTDETVLTEERTDEISDVLARQMGYAPQAKAS